MQTSSLGGCKSYAYSNPRALWSLSEEVKLSFAQLENECVVAGVNHIPYARQTDLLFTSWKGCCRRLPVYCNSKNRQKSRRHLYPCTRTCVNAVCTDTSRDGQASALTFSVRIGIKQAPSEVFMQLVWLVWLTDMRAKQGSC